MPVGGWALGCLLCSGAQWLVGFAAGPESVQQDSELTGDRDDCPLLALFATFAALVPSQPQAPAPEVAICTEGPQDVVCCLHQQAPQEDVACFGDMQLRVLAAALPACRRQPQVGRHIPARGKALGILEGEDESREVIGPT